MTNRTGYVWGAVTGGALAIALIWAMALLHGGDQWQDPEWLAARCRVYANHLYDHTLSLYEEVQYEHDCHK